MIEPTEREHEPACAADRCPVCASNDLIKMEQVYICRECQYTDSPVVFISVFCICGFIAADRAEREVE